MFVGKKIIVEFYEDGSISFDRDIGIGNKEILFASAWLRIKAEKALEAYAADYVCDVDQRIT